MDDSTNPFESEGRPEADGENIARFRKHLALFDGAMLAMPAFIDAMARVQDPKALRMHGFVVMIWLNCMGMRDSLLVMRGDRKRMRNPVALAVLARAIQEAFVGMFYFCVEQVDDEAAFREILWFRQAAFKHIQLSALLPASIRESKEVTTKVKGFKELVKKCKKAIANSHAFVKLQTRDEKFAERLLGTDDKHLGDQQSAIWERAGFDKGTFRSSWIEFSQTAHATPYAVEQLFRYRADGETSVPTVTLPVMVALSCLVKAVRFAAAAFPEVESAAKPVVETVDDYVRS